MRCRDQAQKALLRVHHYHHIQHRSTRLGGMTGGQCDAKTCINGQGRIRSPCLEDEEEEGLGALPHFSRDVLRL